MAARFQTYEQVIDFLYSRINYERMSAAGSSPDDFKLDRVRHLLAQLGDPQEHIPAIHVAGTKGKGSTSVMAAGILHAAGYRTGLFVSPHITSFEERMSIDGRSPSPTELVALSNRVAEVADEMDRQQGRMAPTYFELATAMAWLFFREYAVDVAVLEVGLGGRLDATNVCRPLVTIITNISRDHTRILGNSPAAIAREKAGIVKAGVPLLTGVEPGPAADAIVGVCRERQSPCLRIGREITWQMRRRNDGRRARSSWGEWKGVPIPLRGEHQATNAALAVAAVGRLGSLGWKIGDGAIVEGLRAVRWPARIELLQQRPTVIVDAAHNWESTRALLATLGGEFQARRRILVFAATRDKDVAGLLRQLTPHFDSIVLTQYQSNPRALPISELETLWHALACRSAHIASDPATAWRLARRMAADEDLICVAGSFFIAAELRDLILEDAATRGDAHPAAEVRPVTP